MTAVLHHVALTVTDIEVSLAWYSDLFGFKELVREFGLRSTSASKYRRSIEHCGLAERALT